MAYEAIDGRASTSFTDQEFTDELAKHQLVEAKRKLTLESTTQFLRIPKKSY
ncbi:hypothetical protein MCG01_05010 [Enterococcus hirae]|nr:hypothetical protein [Enterococcus hirae]